MRVLVVGARGHVGAAAAQALMAGGHDVVLGVRRPQAARDRRLDLQQPDSFAGALEGCEGLVLIRPPQVSNVEATLFPLIDQARRAGVSRVAFLSVLGAASAPRVVPHRRVEEYLAASGMLSTLLRAGFFMQNLVTAYADDIRLGNQILLPAGDASLAFVDARDVGEVAALAISRADLRGRALDLTGAEALSFSDVADVLSRTLGRTIRYRPVSWPEYLLRQATRLPLAQAVVQTLIHVQVRGGGAARVDPTLGQVLGHTPRTLEAFVTEHASVW